MKISKLDKKWSDGVFLKGWEKSCLFRVVEITDSYIVVDTGWAILNKCDLWDIELIEVSK